MFSRCFSFCLNLLWVDKKDKVNFKIYDVATCLTSNCNTLIAQFLRCKGNQAVKLGHLIKYITRDIFYFKIHAKNEAGTVVPELFLCF